MAVGDTHPVLVIGGPTASGKSGLAVAVATTLNGVVINADSMQLYDGLPMLSAQPSAAETAQAPHKLYGVLSPDDVCTAARWRDMALDDIDAAHAQGRIPVITGGTGFYLKTLLRGMSPIPDIPPDIRTRLNAQQKDMGNIAFHGLLAAQDPVMAARLHPGNSQRVVRAMEVLAHTGQSLAAWQDLPPEGPPAHLRFVFVTLLPPRAQLYQQCNQRFLDMLDAGVLDEVAAFPHPDTTRGRDIPLHKALGYPELRAYLDGHSSRDDAIIAAQQSTRHYAKRQMTWFRNQFTADLVLERADVDAVQRALHT